MQYVTPTHSNRLLIFAANLNAIHDFRNNKNENQSHRVRSDSNAALLSGANVSNDRQKEALLQLVRSVVYELDISNKYVI